MIRYVDSGRVRLDKWPLVLLAVLGWASVVRAGGWEMLPEQQHDVKISRESDEINIRTTGHDPFLVGRLHGEFSKDQILEFECRCPSGIEQMQVFLGPAFSVLTQHILPDIPSSTQWETYTAEIDRLEEFPLAHGYSTLRIDFGSRAGKRFQIRQLNLRTRSAAEQQRYAKRMESRNSKIDRSANIREYLSQTFPARIDSVSVRRNQIVVSGDHIPAEVPASDLTLIDLPPWHSIGNADAGIQTDVPIEADGTAWRATVPRYNAGNDRLHSSWRLGLNNGSKTRSLTARHYATRIDPAGTNHASDPMRPKNQKGLAGVVASEPLGDVLELGASAITVNIELSRFVTNHPGPSDVRIDVPGDPIYFTTGGFPPHDQIIEWARKHNIVVTAIILIASPHPGTASSALVHPGNDGGHFAMPDLSSERGSGVYAHVLDAIARRYSNTEKSPGGISNWIAHNEIDFHTVWTNMGQRPRELTMETYYRSMRMIHNAARQHNPHARVFASLTHSWTVPDVEDWTRLAPRDVLLSLQAYSLAEGDFAWGVAYHPYCGDLFAPVAWRETNMNATLETPHITMQNIEVLGRFLEQASMLNTDGEARPVLLSEQGFHTDSYGPSGQAQQAGSIAYAMRNARKVPMIESFHYHRLIDHPGEGGLKLGLRTLPTRKNPFGLKKKSWFVYQSIGTPRESEATRDLPSPPSFE